MAKQQKKAAKLVKKVINKPLKKDSKKKKKSKTVSPMGIARVKATFNNTIVTITDLSGNVISWSSAGKEKYVGSKKSSAFAASMVAKNAARDAMNLGMKECEVHLKGPGAGRESAVRALQAEGLTLTIIKDVTPVSHNGCRARKRRRV